LVHVCGVNQSAIIMCRQCEFILAVSILLSFGLASSKGLNLQDSVHKYHL
jgi:hypothetical protein